MTELFSYDFMQRALTATVCMAVLCPVIGIFLVLRRTSMTGDALAHASLAGVAVGLAGGVNPVGASFIFTSAAALLIEALRGLFKNFSDLILTIVLALSVGIAVTLITSGAVHANAESFLFGSILTVTDEDLVIVGLLTAAALLLGALNYNALVCIAFDEEAYRCGLCPHLCGGCCVIDSGGGRTCDEFAAHGSRCHGTAVPAGLCKDPCGSHDCEPH